MYMSCHAPDVRLPFSLVHRTKPLTASVSTSLVAVAVALDPWLCPYYGPHGDHIGLWKSPSKNFVLKKKCPHDSFP